MWWTYSEIFSVVWKHTRNISCEVFSPYPDSRAGYISWCSNSCHSHATTNFLVACSHNDILEMIQDFIKDNNKTIKMSMPINFSFYNQKMMDFLNSNILFLLKLKTPGKFALFICWISSTNPTDEKCILTSLSCPQSEESWTSCTHTFFVITIREVLVNLISHPEKSFQNPSYCECWL